jgi:tRNA A37 threonylcarbamoyladenosine biosynthesis protein TsaE
VILKSYNGKIGDEKIEFVHIDGYRAETLEDIKSVGIEDFLNRRDVVMTVEWPEKIQEIFETSVIDIYFKFLDENTREIKMEV